MTNEFSETLAKLSDRNHELESRYTHLQRTVETLNEVVIEQGKKIDRLEQRVAELVKQLGTVMDREHEPRSLEEEKPPHY